MKYKGNRGRPSMCFQKTIFLEAADQMRQKLYSGKKVNLFYEHSLEEDKFLKFTNQRSRIIEALLILTFFPMFLINFMIEEAYGSSTMVSHKADYTLSMGKRNQTATVQDVKGKISFTLKVLCDGYSLKEDYLFQFFYETGEDVTILSHSDSWEHENGQLYSFDVREQNSFEPENIYTGYAILPPQSDIAEANYAGAYDDNLKLSNDIMFPMTYTRAIIDAAQKGKKFMSGKIFVNSTPEDAIMTATAAIGKKKQYKSALQINGVTTSFYWPIDVAYFREDATEATPEYQIQMELHDNGVVTDFLINYGDFTINADISNATLIENVDCM